LRRPTCTGTTFVTREPAGCSARASTSAASSCCWATRTCNGSKPPELKIRQVGKFKLIADEEVQTYINDVGRRLIPAYQRDLPASDPGKLNFRFFVVANRDANAFALANGTVVVNAGLFAVLENEAKLAAVVGHEIAHATQEHTWRQMQYHKKKRIGVAIAAAFAHAYGQYALSDLLNMTLGAIQNGYSRSL
jgi:predicted Zn-dependent protease